MNVSLSIPLYHCQNVFIYPTKLQTGCQKQEVWYKHLVPIVVFMFKYVHKNTCNYIYIAYIYINILHKCIHIYLIYLNTYIKSMI